MSLLDTIEGLTKTRPLGRDEVEGALDVSLRGDPENQNRYIEVLRSFRNAPGIKAVELRLPLRGATRKDGMLLVDLDPAASETIPGDAVRARFGEPSEVIEPEPEQPKDAPHYLSYTRPWGFLRFGYAKPSWDVLLTFVIDVER
ncbi:MAG: hypothetical protein JNL21_14760 [Myxococcales bacterium]|nr:hypothetical protein [Myxococcales bacterium]